ncbi:hypothetical protein KFL_004810110 [Klebsormidium nitens]|uniref:Uncharacterized protein n=1 Tax=Klebsormidium nitens TaxID=105231 RepID=A0A1Y1ILQ4_KLENI|nr:hypothetical protein KFL_004810110 [Klebsormidium nitens]|eukprot:GAQ89038.1 hypothetical protein KFL_004810110 [Klebsormidium nitens]
MAARSALRGRPLLGIGAVYAVGINAGAAATFWYDKECAKRKQWRVSENALCLTAALGGWIGGMWAMQQFRHKTQKKSFQEKYYASVAGNVAALTLGSRTVYGKRLLATLLKR